MPCTIALTHSAPARVFAGAATAQHQPGGPRPAIVAGLAVLLMRMRETEKS
jgi:hypothetical protein